jgi:hypothetical protein
MQKKETPLRRRIAPSVPLALELIDSDGSKFVKTFKLSFDMNAAAEIQLRTERTVRYAVTEGPREGETVEEQRGLLLSDLSIMSHIGEPVFLSIAFWAAILAHHPEYHSEEGLEVIRSYMQESNMEPIGEAVWQAYLAWLPPAKKEWILKYRAEEEEKRARRLRGEKVEDDEPDPSMPEREASPASLSDGSSSGPSPVTTSASAKANSAS